jgi:copper chaperone CopZ
MKITALLISFLVTLNVFAAKVEVDVSGMSCGMCVEAITRELKETEKAEKISVSLEHKKAYFEEVKGKKVSDAEVKAAIKKAGYEAVKIYRK